MSQSLMHKSSGRGVRIYAKAGSLAALLFRRSLKICKADPWVGLGRGQPGSTGLRAIFRYSAAKTRIPESWLSHTLHWAMAVLINDSTSAAIFPLSRQKPSQPRSRRQLRRPSYAKMNARVGKIQARRYSLVKLLVLQIDARDAFADRAQNFVRNRPQLSRDFVSGDT